MLTVLIPVAIVALIVIIGVIAFQRGAGGIDLSPQAMLRAYLYVGHFQVVDRIDEHQARACLEPCNVGGDRLLDLVHDRQVDRVAAPAHA